MFGNDSVNVKLLCNYPEIASLRKVCQNVEGLQVEPVDLYVRTSSVTFQILKLRNEQQRKLDSTFQIVRSRLFSFGLDIVYSIYLFIYFSSLTSISIIPVQRIYIDLVLVLFEQAVMTEQCFVIYCPRPKFRDRNSWISISEEKFQEIYSSDLRVGCLDAFCEDTLKNISLTSHYCSDTLTSHYCSDTLTSHYCSDTLTSH